MKIDIQKAAQRAEQEQLQPSDHARIGHEFCVSLKRHLRVCVMTRSFTKSTGHSHNQFAEVYVVTKGTLRIALYSPLDGAVTEVELGELDSITIPAGVSHKVIGGSPDNIVIVTCDPVFVPGDEQFCKVLEGRYLAPADPLTNFSFPARPAHCLPGRE